MEEAGLVGAVTEAMEVEAELGVVERAEGSVEAGSVVEAAMGATETGGATVGAVLVELAAAERREEVAAPWAEAKREGAATEAVD